MTWNHRIIRQARGSYGLYEVYYDDKGNITDWTTDPVDVSGDSPKEIKALLTLMLKDCDRPILNATTLEKLKGGDMMAAKKKAAKPAKKK